MLTVFANIEDAFASVKAGVNAEPIPIESGEAPVRKLEPVKGMDLNMVDIHLLIAGSGKMLLRKYVMLTSRLFRALKDHHGKHNKATT